MKKIYDLLRNLIFFILGILIPIAATVSLNLGLIFKCGYPFDSFWDLIYSLSLKNTHSLDSGYLIGIASAFIVFFAIASWIYSFNYITPNIVRNYILKHYWTFMFFGIQSGFGIVLSYFTYKSLFYYINYLVSIIFLFLSVTVSVIYFYWLSKIILPKNIFSELLSKINFKHLESFEKTVKDKQTQLKELIEDSTIPIIIKQDDFLFFYERNQTRIYWKGIGYVQDIDIQKLDRLLNKYKDHLESIKLDAKVGDSLPNEDIYGPNKERTKTLILTITYLSIFKPNERSLSDTEYQKRIKIQQDIKFAIEQLEDQLIGCFKIERKGSLVDKYYDIIEDIFSLYNQKIKNDYTLSKIFFENLSDFFLNIYENFEYDEEWSTDRNLKEIVLNRILKYVGNTFKPGMTDSELKELLSLIYTINHLAIKQESIKLHSPLINLISDLIYYSLLFYDKSINMLRVSLLHLKELTFSVDLFEHLKEKKDNQINISFYNRIIINGSNAAVISIRTIIDYFQRMPIPEAKKYLIDNTQYLIDFLTPLNHLTTENLTNTNINSIGQNILKDRIKVFAQNITYLALYIFKNVENEQLPENLIYDISFLMTQNCNNAGKHQFKSEDFLTEFFYDYFFNTPIETIASGWFETPPIHEAGTYSPGFYDFAPFWISYSIFQKSINIKNDFIPKRKPKDDETWGEREIVRIIDKYDIISKRVISKLEKEELHAYLNQYRRHLEGFLEKSHE